ncbi:MAG: hypothetical protein WCY56_03120 [Aminobacteriaceae bacterium]
MANIELEMARKVDWINKLRIGESFYWWRPGRVELVPEGRIFGNAMFVSGPTFRGETATDRSRKVFAYLDLENRHVSREAAATLIARVRKIETDGDILEIVKDYGVLHADAEWKQPLDLWRWQSDTPEDWRRLAAELNEVFTLIKRTETRDPGADEARQRLADMLSEHVNACSIRTYYAALPSGDTAPVSGVPFDLHAMIWKVVEATATQSNAAKYLRLRECYICGEWDFETEGEGSRQMRERRDGLGWHHDGCYRRKDKQERDEARAEREERQRHERPTAKKGSPVFSDD